MKGRSAFYQKRRRSPLFALGRLQITHAAYVALNEAGVALGDLLERHQRGDWGLVDELDRKQNELGLRLGLRLRSIYRIQERSNTEIPLLLFPSNAAEIWIITSSDRARTHVLLPDEIFNESKYQS